MVSIQHCGTFFQFFLFSFPPPIFSSFFYFGKEKKEKKSHERCNSILACQHDARAHMSTYSLTWKSTDLGAIEIGWRGIWDNLKNISHTLSRTLHYYYMGHSYCESKLVSICVMIGVYDFKW